MLRRLLVVSGGVMAAAVLASPAFAADVNIRVEGDRVTIWGKTDRRVEPVTGTFSPPQGPDVTVAGATPFGALERASRKGEFFYRVRSTSFGPYVSRIGRRRAAGSSGWVFKVNHISPPVGADAYELQEGDDVLWYWATFGPSGGPKTLDLARGGRGCFRAFAYDDSGDRSRPRTSSSCGTVAGRSCRSQAATARRRAGKRSGRRSRGWSAPSSSGARRCRSRRSGGRSARSSSSSPSPAAVGARTARARVPRARPRTAARRSGSRARPARRSS